MKHYIKVCLRVIATGRIDLLIIYLRLVVKSFLAYRKRRQGPIQERILNRSVRGFHYPQLINLFEEVFIWKVYSFSPKGNAPVIIDCGSNIGMSVIYFKSLYPESRIIAFEPDGITFRFLVDNVTDNKLLDVEMHQVALSNVESEVILYSNPGSSGKLTMSLFKSTDATDENKVTAKKLSTYINSEIDVLKIDAEGAEVLIVNDLIDSAKIKLVRQMIIEYHPAITKQSVGSFMSLLEGQDFLCSHERDTLHPGATEIMVRAIRNDRN